MALYTYQRIHLPTKRLGVEAGDWVWIAPSIFPGLIFRSFLLFVLFFLMAYLYASKVKPRKPRGWLAGKLEYWSRPHRFVAELEENF